MKTKLLILLFFLIVFAGCQKDDDLQPIQLQYAIFNDKPNPVNNNQVSLSFPSETKIELVIFGGDGTYSISNSDDTKLGISRIDGYLTLTPFAPGNVIVSINDGHDNSYTLNVQIVDWSIKLNVKEKSGNIFDLIEFEPYLGNDLTIGNLVETYDSIVWVCANTDLHFKILSHSSNSLNFLSKWSNCFFLPAEYETVLLGYKNNRIISSDTVSVNITNKKDFLGFNWEDVIETSKISTGYQNVFEKGYDFATGTVVNDDIPSVHLFLFPVSNENEVLFAQKSRQVLLNYISSIYSSPTYSDDEIQLLSEVYNTFKNKEQGTTPECIWITPKSKIALIKRLNEVANYLEYEIYSEPVQ